MEEQLTDALVEKMQAEQEDFIAALRTMPPEKILNLAREYIGREDVLMALAFKNLPIEQAQALLKSPSPLADIVKEYRHQGVDDERIFDAIKEAAKPNMEPPIYRQSAQYAMEHGERDAYFASWKAYENCSFAIDQAICTYYDGMHLDEDCLSEVVTKHSPERITNVLACTIQQKEWDGRFSRDNRAWANGIDTSHMGEKPYPFMANSHPAVLDGFAGRWVEVYRSGWWAALDRETPPSG